MKKMLAFTLVMTLLLGIMGTIQIQAAAAVFANTNTNGTGVPVVYCNTPVAALIYTFASSMGTTNLDTSIIKWYTAETSNAPSNEWTFVRQNQLTEKDNKKPGSRVEYAFAPTAPEHYNKFIKVKLTPIINGVTYDEIEAVNHNGTYNRYATDGKPWYFDSNTSTTATRFPSGGGNGSTDYQVVQSFNETTKVLSIQYGSKTNISQPGIGSASTTNTIWNLYHAPISGKAMVQGKIKITSSQDITNGNYFRFQIANRDLIQFGVNSFGIKLSRSTDGAFTINVKKNGQNFYPQSGIEYDVKFVIDLANQMFDLYIDNERLVQNHDFSNSTYSTNNQNYENNGYMTKAYMSLGSATIASAVSVEIRDYKIFPVSDILLNAVLEAEGNPSDATILAAQTQINNLSLDSKDTVKTEMQGRLDIPKAVNDDANLLATLGAADLQNVTTNLLMPAVGANGSEISWTSSNEIYVGTDGTVRRPFSDAGDQTVNVTGTFTKGKSIKTVNYTVVVKKSEASPDELDVLNALNAIPANLGIADITQITESLTLPTFGSNGVEISWATSDAVTITTSGVVTRPSYSEGDKQVTLAATASKNGIEALRQFVVTVVKLPMTPGEAVIFAESASMSNITEKTALNQSIINAQKLITAMGNGTDKDELQRRIDIIYDKFSNNANYFNNFSTALARKDNNSTVEGKEHINYYETVFDSNINKNVIKIYYNGVGGNTNFFYQLFGPRHIDVGVTATSGLIINEVNVKISAPTDRLSSAGLSVYSAGYILAYIDGEQIYYRNTLGNNPIQAVKNNTWYNIKVVVNNSSNNIGEFNAQSFNIYLDNQLIKANEPLYATDKLSAADTRNRANQGIAGVTTESTIYVADTNLYAMGYTTFKSMMAMLQDLDDASEISGFTEKVNEIPPAGANTSKNHFNAEIAKIDGVKSIANTVDLGDLREVTSLVLPSYINNKFIGFESDKDIISSNNTIKRPIYKIAENASLTATVKDGAVQYSKTFDISVKGAISIDTITLSDVIISNANTDEDATVTLILGLYRSTSNSLLEAYTKTITIPKGGQTIENFTLQTEVENNIVKAFVWKDFTSAMPITKSKQ